MWREVGRKEYEAWFIADVPAVNNQQLIIGGHVVLEKQFKIVRIQRERFFYMAEGHVHRCWDGSGGNLVCLPHVLVCIARMKKKEKEERKRNHGGIKKRIRG